jgi:C1A family cysteine protease
MGESFDKSRTLSMGWLPDYPDFRDYTPETPEVALILKKTKLGAPRRAKSVKLSNAKDLRTWCSPIEDQKDLGSCTANAGVGLVEYFEMKAYQKYIDASRLFLYKTTRNLLHLTGDTGAFLRSTMGAMVLFGLPPEEYWPYTTKKADFDMEPPAFCYSFAGNYKAIKYVRLDPSGISTNDLLQRIKEYLDAEVPSMFGFVVYNSIYQASNNGNIPYPCKGERQLGGHAVVAVGYDDNKKIKNNQCETETNGALLIRNSWGTEWGEEGYGWLPYEYVLKGLAIDWWTLLNQDWVDAGIFKE